MKKMIVSSVAACVLAATFLFPVTSFAASTRTAGYPEGPSYGGERQGDVGSFNLNLLDCNALNVLSLIPILGGNSSARCENSFNGVVGGEEQ